jgi:putative endopeptidase
MKRILYLLVLAFIAVSCNQKKEATKNKIDFEGISENIKPGDNFFEHVNKKWLDAAVIADDQVGVGSYSFLNIPQKVLLENILTEVSAETHEKGSIQQMVGDFYASGMDTVSINKLGFTPLASTFHKIDAIHNIPSLMSFVAAELRSGNASIMSMYVSPDNENSKVNMLHFGQTGLGLPDRDYYFNADAQTIAVQEAYQKLLETVLLYQIKKTLLKKQPLYMKLKRE